jgi:hypothetical protein
MQPNASKHFHTNLVRRRNTNAQQLGQEPESWAPGKEDQTDSHPLLYGKRSPIISVLPLDVNSKFVTKQVKHPVR